MAWQQEQLQKLVMSREFYLEWIADIEGGKDPIVTRREMGKVVDDIQERLERYRRNVQEIETILSENEVPFSD